jgi:hypothetical protein
MKTFENVRIKGLIESQVPFRLSIETAARLFAALRMISEEEYKKWLFDETGTYVPKIKET